jgi:glycosyltransferase involved in cell wall biosynthesis
VPTLSVVIPTYNEEPHQFAQTLRALEAELTRGPWRDPELIVVDDGSSTPVQLPTFSGLASRVIRQHNFGRFEARRAGIEAARGEYVLLLDSRVMLDPGALSWVAQEVVAGASAWNGHCITDNLASPYARFWDIIVRAAWSDYLRQPRTTSFGIDEYDRYPKGTGHFLAPRSWLCDAIADFVTLYDDRSLSSDDTHLLRSIARRDRIHISPKFSSTYRGRESLGAFMRNAMYRGTTFVDGHIRRGSRFRPLALGVAPASLAGVLIGVRHPRVGGCFIVVVGAAGTAFARWQGRSVREAASFGVLMPPFVAVYSAGIWRGVLMALRHRMRSAS